jgi:hypothetical protein
VAVEQPEGTVATAPAKADGPADRGGDERPTGLVARFASPSLDAVVLCIALVICVRIGAAPIQDNSFLTHLATGRIILESGSVPDADPYSWTAHGDPWTVQSWLASVIYAGLEDLAGIGAIRLLTTVLVFALVLILWRLTDVAETLVPRALSIFLVLMVGVGMWTERPFMFGAVGLALVLLAAEDRLDPRWLVPAMWVWANTHGSFPFAPALIGMLLVGRWLDERTLPKVELRCLLWTVVGTAISVAGPLGLRVLAFPFQMLDKSEAFMEVREWKPLDLSSSNGRIFLAQLLVAAVAVIRGRRWRLLIPTLVFGVAALSSARNVLQASIVLTPIIATGLSGLGRIDGSRRPSIAQPAVHALTIVLIVFAGFSFAAPSTHLDPYPREATAWMVENGLLGVDTRVVSRDVAGNYMEYEYGPDEVRVFIDDRVDMYPLELVRTYLDLFEEDGGHAAALEGMDPTAVLWDQKSPLGRWIQEADDWDVVWRDDVWLVAVPAGTGLPARSDDGGR